MANEGVEGEGEGAGQTPIMATRAHDNCTLHYP